MERASLFVGGRGTGKTVMLNEVEHLARDYGWHVVAETATPGLLDRLVQQRLPELLRRIGPDFSGWRLKALSGFGVGAEWEATAKFPYRPDLRAQLAEVSDVVARTGAGGGLVLTVDEIHGGHRDELRELGATIQHCFREERPIALRRRRSPGRRAGPAAEGQGAHVPAPRRPLRARRRRPGRGPPRPRGPDHRRRAEHRSGGARPGDPGQPGLPVPHPAHRRPAVAPRRRRRRDQPRHRRARRAHRPAPHGPAAARAGARRPEPRRPAVPRRDGRGRRPLAPARHRACAWASTTTT